jgi:hypothetical protein
VKDDEFIERARAAVARTELKNVSKHTAFEIFGAAGNLQSHIDDANAGRPFDVVAYESCKVRWLGLAGATRDIMRAVLCVVERTGPVGPRSKLDVEPMSASEIQAAVGVTPEERERAREVAGRVFRCSICGHPERLHRNGGCLDFDCNCCQEGMGPRDE